MRGSLRDGWTASTEARDESEGTGPPSGGGGRRGNGGGTEGGGEEGGSGQEDFEDYLSELKGGLCFVVVF